MHMTKIWSLHFYYAFLPPCEGEQPYTSPPAQSSEARLFHPLDQHARNTPSRGEMVPELRRRAPSPCTAWNNNRISCKGVGGWQTDGCDVKAEPAVSLACRANNWLYFLGTACLQSEKAWLSTLLTVVSCFCFFPLLFFQDLHFLIYF